MIFNEAKNLQPLTLPKWSRLISEDWAEPDSPAGRLIAERRRLLARREEVAERFQRGRLEVQEQLAAAQRQVTQVAATSSPNALAAATAVAGSAPQILAAIEREARQEGDAITRHLAQVEDGLKRLLTPLTLQAQGYNTRVGEYGAQVAILKRSGGDHGESVVCHEFLALCGVNAEFFKHVFEQVAGRAYDGAWGFIGAHGQQ